jgi:hypothetical protein
MKLSRQSTEFLDAKARTIALLHEHLKQRRAAKLKYIVKTILSRFLYLVAAGSIRIGEISWI